MNALEISKTTAVTFFNEHPEARRSVVKAAYAYAKDEMQNTGHRFKASRKWGVIRRKEPECCIFCGRSREDVRWDELPAHCLQRTTMESISDVVLEEEVKYQQLLERGKTEIPKLLKRGIPRQVMWETYGYDDDTINRIVSNA